jgi:hypothetical protein
MADQGSPAADVDSKDDKWWHSALWGLASFGLAAFLYFDLSAFERDGGTKRVKWYIAFLYNTLGKWGVVGLFVLLGVGLLGFAVAKLRSRPQS